MAEVETRREETPGRGQEPPEPMTARRRVYFILFGTRKSDHLSRAFDLMLIALILLNVLAVVLESVEALRIAHRSVFWGFETFSVFVFTLEYGLRVWSIVEAPDARFKDPVRGRLRYLATPMAVVDLLAILPFYLGMLFKADLRFLRVLRLLRMFKLTRYNAAMTLLLKVLHRESGSFMAAMFVLAVVMIIAASLVYLFEHQAQPEAFGNIPQAMWWAVVTLTTVGYGDAFPVTGMGKFFGALISVLGVGMVALPAGIIASGFSEELRLRREQYEDMVDEVLEDGAVTGDEYAELNAYVARTGLTPDEAQEALRRAVKRDVMERCPHCGEPLHKGPAEE